MPEIPAGKFQSDLLPYQAISDAWKQPQNMLACLKITKNLKSQALLGFFGCLERDIRWISDRNRIPNKLAYYIYTYI